MKKLRPILGFLAALATVARGADDWLDRIDDSLTTARGMTPSGPG